MFVMVFFLIQNNVEICSASKKKFLRKGWEHFKKLMQNYQTTWTSEYQTSSLLEWSILTGIGHLNTRPFEIRTHSPDFKWSRLAWTVLLIRVIKKYFIHPKIVWLEVKKTSVRFSNGQTIRKPDKKVRFLNGFYKMAAFYHSKTKHKKRPKKWPFEYGTARYSDVHCTQFCS
jgi:hypothetical protein